MSSKEKIMCETYWVFDKNNVVLAKGISRQQAWDMLETFNSVVDGIFGYFVSGGYWCTESASADGTRTINRHGF